MLRRGLELSSWVRAPSVCEHLVRQRDEPVFPGLHVRPLDSSPQPSANSLVQSPFLSPRCSKQKFQSITHWHKWLLLSTENLLEQRPSSYFEVYCIVLAPWQWVSSFSCSPTTFVLCCKTHFLLIKIIGHGKSLLIILYIILGDNVQVLSLVCSILTFIHEKMETFHFSSFLDAVQQFYVITEMGWQNWDPMYQIFGKMVVFERLKQ